MKQQRSLPYRLQIATTTSTLVPIVINSRIGVLALAKMWQASLAMQLLGAEAAKRCSMAQPKLKLIATIASVPQYGTQAARE
jgi:hypothetical protein